VSAETERARDLPADDVSSTRLTHHTVLERQLLPVDHDLDAYCHHHLTHARRVEDGRAENGAFFGRPF
jgi:hypothetical protein